MKRQTHLAHTLTAGTLLLIGTLALAQTAPQKKTTNTHGSSGNPPVGIAVDHAGGNGVRRAVGTHGQPSPSGVTPAASASTTTTTRKKHLAGVKYQDFSVSRSGGENPLYEPQNKANLKSSAGKTASHP